MRWEHIRKRTVRLSKVVASIGNRPNNRSGRKISVEGWGQVHQSGAQRQATGIDRKDQGEAHDPPRYASSRRLQK
jgi:hypothetical protein